MRSSATTAIPKIGYKLRNCGMEGEEGLFEGGLAGAFEGGEVGGEEDGYTRGGVAGREGLKGCTVAELTMPARQGAAVPLEGTSHACGIMTAKASIYSMEEIILIDGGVAMNKGIESITDRYYFTGPGFKHLYFGGVTII